jgi:acid phosphatase (class A)
MTVVKSILIITAMGFASSVSAQVAAPAQAAPAARPALPTGYLTPQTWPDAAKILPLPPTTGSAREAVDQGVFRATRALDGTPRWAMAQADVPTLPDALLKGFSCAVGVDLSAQTAPKLTMLLSRTAIDMGRQVSAVKEVFKRKRPYLIEPGKICVPPSVMLDNSPDYPSGHSTWGWSVGLILSELAPDRATPILNRGRAFGESRVVCGVHSPSAVEAGRTNGAALIATLHGQSAFRADLEAAREELAALRAKATPMPASCAATLALDAQAVY